VVIVSCCSIVFAPARNYSKASQAFEVVWPAGEVIRLSSASVDGYTNSGSHGGNPSGLGIDFYRLVQIAQGMLDIVTYPNLNTAFKTMTVQYGSASVQGNMLMSRVLALVSSPGAEFLLRSPFCFFLFSSGFFY
jgi:hypothetical protein